MPKRADHWTTTAPHPNPLPAARGEGESSCCGSALLPPRPMKWGEGWGEGPDEGRSSMAIVLADASPPSSGFLPHRRPLTQPLTLRGSRPAASVPRCAGRGQSSCCGSALLPPRPMKWGEGWGEGQWARQGTSTGWTAARIPESPNPRIHQSTPQSLARQHLARVEDAVGIEGMLDRAMEGERSRAEGAGDPRQLGQPDAVLAGDGAAVGQDP